LIKININGNGAIKAIQGLRRDLFEIETIGKVLYHASSVIWIKHIKDRLHESTGASAYEYSLNRTMFELDPDFVNGMVTHDWALQTEAQRRTPGGYKKGNITKKIESAIKASPPIKGDGYIAVGIANIDLLNSLAGLTGTNAKIEIWRVLQFGTGLFNPFGPKAVVRTGNQVFFSSKTGNGIQTQKTVNPGFRGREYFVRLDGDIHRDDVDVKQYIIEYMKRITKKYSFK